MLGKYRGYLGIPQRLDAKVDLELESVNLYFHHLFDVESKTRQKKIWVLLGEVEDNPPIDFEQKYVITQVQQFKQIKYTPRSNTLKLEIKDYRPVTINLSHLKVNKMYTFWIDFKKDQSDDLEF